MLFPFQSKTILPIKKGSKIKDIEWKKFPIVNPNIDITNKAIPNPALPKDPNTVSNTLETCPTGTAYLLGLKDNGFLLLD